MKVNMSVIVVEYSYDEFDKILREKEIAPVLLTNPRL